MTNEQQTTEQQVSEAINLALAPEEGEPFHFGDKDFTLQYLSVAGEQALFKLVMPRLKHIGAESNMADLFEGLADLLPKAGALILSDQDPTVTEEWVLSVRGPGVSKQLFDLVFKQFVLNDMGKFFAPLLQIAGLLQSLSGRATA